MIGMLGVSIIVYMVIFHVIVGVFYKRINEKENATMLTAFFGGGLVLLFMLFLPLSSMLFDPMYGFDHISLTIRIIIWGMIYIAQSVLYTGMVLSMNTYKRKYKIQKV